MSHSLEDDGPEDPDDYTLRPISGHFVDVFAARKVKPKWVIKNVMTTGLTLVIGPAKDAFKTTIEMAFALLIAKKEHAVLPREWKALLHGPALIFEDESDAGEIREILEDGMGVYSDPDESIMVAERPHEYRLDDAQSVEQMIHWAEERDVRMIGLGPLANFHNTDEKDASAVMNILRPLRRFAKDTDKALIITHHTRKIEEGKVYTANDARGSSALFGLCDNILVITPGKEPYELLVSRKGKKGPAWEQTFFLNIWDRKGKTNRPAFRQIDKMILRAILQGFKARSAIVNHIGLNEKQVTARLAALRQDGILLGDANAYRLKEPITLEDLG